MRKTQYPTPTPPLKGRGYAHRFMRGGLGGGLGGRLDGNLADGLADGLANEYPDDYTRGAHPECNIPAPQGEGSGVGSVTSTQEDNIDISRGLETYSRDTIFNAENQIPHPYPSPQGEGICAPLLKRGTWREAWRTP